MDEMDDMDSMDRGNSRPLEPRNRRLGDVYPENQALLRRARDIVRLLRREYGTPRLPRRDPLDVLIQTILSQKTTGESCRKAFESLKGSAGTWERARRMPVGRIEAAIRPAGLGRQKALRIKAILERLRRNWGKVILKYKSDKTYKYNRTNRTNRTNGTNRTYERNGAEGGFSSLESLESYLLSLPGVGLKTARCVLLFALGAKVLPVDTHIARLARRLGLVPGNSTPDRIAEMLEGIVAPGDRPGFHVNGFLHGRSVCRSLRPRCGACVLRRLCPSRQGQ